MEELDASPIGVVTPSSILDLVPGYVLLISTRYAPQASPGWIGAGGGWGVGGGGGGELGGGGDGVGESGGGDGNGGDEGGSQGGQGGRRGQGGGSEGGDKHAGSRLDAPPKRKLRPYLLQHPTEYRIRTCDVLKKVNSRALPRCSSVSASGSVGLSKP